MSRVAKVPVKVATGVSVSLSGTQISVKGPKGTLSLELHKDVEVTQADGEIKVKPRRETKEAWAMAGTTRALVQNLVLGASEGFQKRLQLVGVGYRAQLKGKVLNLSLGYSHPIEYPLPEGIAIETPSQTEIVVSGADKQQVGQVAAKIRGYRPPEPYKGKGVRYADERILRKEAKKKK